METMKGEDRPGFLLMGLLFVTARVYEIYYFLSRIAWASSPRTLASL